MNILDVIRARIIRDFPSISEEELEIRLKIAQELLKSVERKYE
jgi:hypothetical protein